MSDDDTLLIVLEVSSDTPRIPAVIEQLRAHLNAGEVTVRGFDRGYLAIRQDAELILDVFREPELGGGRHVADVREIDDELRWVVEHSLVCRRTGEMTDCPYIDHVYEAHREGVLEAGRWVLEILPQVGFTTPERLQLTPEAEAT